MPSATNKKVTLIVLTVSKNKHKTHSYLCINYSYETVIFEWIKNIQSNQCGLIPEPNDFYESVLLMTCSKRFKVRAHLCCLANVCSLFERNPRKWEFCVRAKDASFATDLSWIFHNDKQKVIFVWGVCNTIDKRWCKKFSWMFNSGQKH